MTSSASINSNDPKQNEPLTSSTGLAQAEIFEIVVMLAGRTMPWLGWRGAGRWGELGEIGDGGGGMVRIMLMLWWQGW